MPTVLDAVGLEAPGLGGRRHPAAHRRGQPPATFDDAAAPDPRDTQYFEMLGSRSIYHGGWKATTDHISTGVVDEEELAVGSRRFGDDHWALFDLAEDFSESTDVAAEHPDVARRLRGAVAGRGRPQPGPAGGRHLRQPDRRLDPAGLAARGRPAPSSRAAGRCTTSRSRCSSGGSGSRPRSTCRRTAPQGCCCALGDWHGGYALFVDDGRLVFTFSRAGELLEVAADRPVPAGRQEVGVAYVVGGDHQGTLTLLHGDTAGGHGRLRRHAAAGHPARRGRPAPRVATPGSRCRPATRRPSPWTGTVHAVRVDTPGAPPPDPAGRGPGGAAQRVTPARAPGRRWEAGPADHAAPGTGRPTCWGAGTPSDAWPGCRQGGRRRGPAGGRLAAGPARSGCPSVPSDDGGRRSGPASGGTCAAPSASPARGARRPEPDPDRAFLRPGGVARQVHGDLPPMVIGGLERAAAPDACTRSAMAGVAEHSDYAGRPAGPAAPDRGVRGRHHLRQRGATPTRPSTRVRQVHRQVHGVAPDGRPVLGRRPRARHLGARGRGLELPPGDRALRRAAPRRRATATPTCARRRRSPSTSAPSGCPGPWTRWTPTSGGSGPSSMPAAQAIEARRLPPARGGPDARRPGRATP